MPVITVGLEKRSYPIIIRRGLLRQVAQMMGDRLRAQAATIITNDRVGPLYLSDLRTGLAARYSRVHTIVLPDGERHKTVAVLRMVYDRLASFDLDRRSPIVALGGGVVGDIAGFAAATFLRGVPLVQVPTTLLAQVDSSVGGKTGVNLKAGKNLVGAFYQPSLVVIDPEVLVTLPERERIAGMAEVIKYALIRRGKLPGILTQHMDKVLAAHGPTLERIILLSCSIKAGVVVRDEREQGIRAHLNYGHTIGHALETLTCYRTYKHGEAVAIGMAAEARIAAELGICSSATHERTRMLIERAGLPTQLPVFPAGRYVQVMQKDKKKSAGMIRMVLPTRIGAVTVREVSPEALRVILKKTFHLPA